MFSFSPFFFCTFSVYSSSFCCFISSFLLHHPSFHRCLHCPFISPFNLFLLSFLFYPFPLFLPACHSSFLNLERCLFVTAQIFFLLQFQLSVFTKIFTLLQESSFQIHIVMSQPETEPSFIPTEPGPFRHVWGETRVFVFYYERSITARDHIHHRARRAQSREKSKYFIRRPVSRSSEATVKRLIKITPVKKGRKNLLADELQRPTSPTQKPPASPKKKKKINCLS